ncbi:MAG TPA: hypothetical protein VN238_00420 [Solirubrobacteraceae bacterium]|nr:hypothetical protein [Solirubrobacteraceae bacterium]
MTDTSQLDTLLRADAPPSVRGLDQASVDALAELVAAEHARRDAEGEAALEAGLAGLPWPVRKAVSKAFGQ